MKRYMSKIFKAWTVVTMMVAGAGMAQAQTIGGAVFGGGRMADVQTNTAVTVVNCDTISAVYGGNDIAGKVDGSDGSTVTIGTAGTGALLTIGSVYGGGNGYYAYDGSSFATATDSYTSQSVAVDGVVKTMTSTHAVGATEWTNTGASAAVLGASAVGWEI